MEKEYLCSQCEITFKIKAGAKKRCPQCMRALGLTEITTDEPKVAPKKKRLSPFQKMFGLAFLVIAVGAAAIYVYLKPQTPVTLQGKEISASQIIPLLKKQQILLEALPWQPSEAIGQTAIKLVKGANTEIEKARAIYGYLTQRLAEKKMTLRLDEEKGAMLPQTASEIHQRLTLNKVPAVSDFEMAIYFFSLGLSAGIGLKLGTIERYENIQVPIEPSGRLSHFVVVLKDPKASEKEGYFIMDPLLNRWAEKGDVSPVSMVGIVAHYYNRRANYFLAKKDNRNALLEVERGLSIQENIPTFHAMRGFIYLAGGGKADAAREFETALSLKKSGVNYFNTGWALMMKKRIGEAVKYIKEAVKIYPDWIQALVMLGNAALLERKGDEAIAAFEKALKKEPQALLVRIHLADAYSLKKEYDKAIQNLLEEAKINKDQLMIFSKLTFLYQLKGDPEKSKMAYEKALSAAPPDKSGEIKKELDRIIALINSQKEKEAQPKKNEDDEQEN